MPDLDGVEVARRLRAKDREVCIVFVTGAKEYVFDAFDVGALHYLLKPIDPVKFAEVIERAHAMCLRIDAAKGEKILIRTKNRTDTLKRSEIIYAESQLKKIVVYISDGMIRKNAASDFPQTDKTDADEHGIGFSNMNMVAKKYHGMVDWHIENGQFVLTVMLQNMKPER